MQQFFMSSLANMSPKFSGLPISHAHESSGLRRNASAGGERSVVLEEESELEVKRHQVGGLDVSFPTYMVWGANTGVGKTLVSAG